MRLKLFLLVNNLARRVTSFDSPRIGKHKNWFPAPGSKLHQLLFVLTISHVQLCI